MSVLVGRRFVVIAALVCAGLGGGVALGVQAVASGGPSPVVAANRVPKPMAVPPAGARTAKGAVVHATTATNVTCGEIVTKSLKLDGDLYCPSGNGLVLANAIKIILNLNGHTISGGRGQSTAGVDVVSPSGEVENGVVTEFGYGVRVDGPNVTVSAVRSSFNSVDGIGDYGLNSKVTNSVAYGNTSDGMYALATGATYTGDHFLNNGGDGITLAGGGSSGVTVTSSVANGNAAYGIYDFDQGTAFSKNVTDYNGRDGIYADEVGVVDAGGNAGKGNDTIAGVTPEECYGVVCS